MKETILVTVLTLLAIVGLVSCSSVNNLVRLDEGVNLAWDNVEAVMQRRYDLIPNLVATVKGYAKHESETLKAVTEARSAWANAKTSVEKMAASGQVESALARLMVVAESYPNLKADQAFSNLQFELAGTENRIAVARRDYNAALYYLNSTKRTMPSSFFVGFANLGEHKRFESESGAKSSVKVNFNDEGK